MKAYFKLALALLTILLPLASGQAAASSLTCATSTNAPLTAQQQEQFARATHLLNRITFGPRPGDVDTVLMVGIENYINQQLTPSTIPENAALLQTLASPTFSSLQKSLPQLVHDWETDKDARKAQLIRGGSTLPILMPVVELSRAKMLRAALSNRQLEEVMVDFWFNHFNVNSSEDIKARLPSYERDAIRPHVLGKFRDLVLATARHPAMLLYLNNAENRAGAINENYARELLELHTLGVVRNFSVAASTARYTQLDVTNLAYLLTGWGVNSNRADRRYHAISYLFNPAAHDGSERTLLGRRTVGGSEEAITRIISDLSSRASTARHIAYKLAVHFVADDPPSSLIRRLAQRFVATDGDIREVMRELLLSPEFWHPANRGLAAKKFKTPFRYAISLTRAANLPPRLEGADLLTSVQFMGQSPYNWLTPDGMPIRGGDWLDADNLLKRISFIQGRLQTQFNATPHADDVTLVAALCPVNFSTHTRNVLNAIAEPRLRAQLLAASPEYLYH